MPRNSEKTVNVKLAECLRYMHPGWNVGAEQTEVFVAVSMQPDIVVSREGGLTVVVETEIAPASTVEKDARSRLEQVVKQTGEKLDQCIAVKLPKSLRTAKQQDLETEVNSATYQFVVFTEEGDDGLYSHIVRWPAKGWLEGSLDDLAGCIETVALSEKRVAEGTKILEMGVGQSAGYLGFHARPFIHKRLADKLQQVPGEQTNRMATAILANAVIFHMRLATLHPKVNDLSSCFAETQIYLRNEVLEAWRAILEINYWPIFKLASDLLKLIPHRFAHHVIDRLERMATRLVEIGAADIQDLSGRMFQQLIADRKFLATFYTLPSSATLLAELAISRLNIDWSKRTAIHSIRVADLACGTGALLAATYHAIASRHRRTGGNDRLLHQGMMEKVFVGADIMPAAVHLTAASLSGMHPDQPFGHTHIINMPYGDKSNGDGVSIGSLDLIQANTTRPVFGTGRAVLSGTGELRDSQRSLEAQSPPIDDSAIDILEVPHGSMDVVIMNPPFTRPTNHESTDVPIPSFAGFSTKEDEQAKMSVKLKEVTQELARPAGHGNAGLASNFIDLAHAKLRPGGVLSLVLPAAFVQGFAWKNARRLIRQHYRDILVVSLATKGSSDRAFSADTGMAEILLVATRGENDESEREKICIANLYSRPKTPLEAGVTARAINLNLADSEMKSGPIRHTEIQWAGSFFRSDDWSAVGIREFSIARFMEAIAAGNLLLPQRRKPVPIPICPLNRLGQRGYLDRDINGRTSDGQPRGPFDIELLSVVPEYPVLWSHDAKRERLLVVAPDSQAVARRGCQERGVKLWHEGASRLHFNRDFRLNSQSLAACLTERVTLGGRAWPNFLTNEHWEIPIVLWANSTMGLVSFWWAGTRQQSGRSILTITRLPQLLSIDASSLSAEQRTTCEQIFDELRDRSFLPANEAYRDEARQALDRMLLIDVLGLDAGLMDHLAILRNQWCAEPSVHGGKETRPH